MTVTVGWIDNGIVRGEFTEAVSKLVAYETAKGRLVSVIRVQAGPLVEIGRNRLVETFLRTGADWFLSVDTDMVFDYDAAERLAATADELDVSMIGGLCFGVNQEYGQFPTIYRNTDGHPAIERDLPDAPVYVDATGAAFTLTHRRLFEQFRRDGDQPWFHRRYNLPTDQHAGGWLGEDISWCFYLREQGVPIVVDPRVEAGHIKAVNVCSDTYAVAR